MRPTAVLNGLAVALLAVSTIAFSADPFPAQVGTPLPTFLGVRTAAEEAREKMNLALALETMDAYRAEHGTYRGFDAAIGTEAEPALAWLDGRPAIGGRDLKAQIVTVGDRTARLVVVAATGTPFCIQRTPTGVTYGSPSDASRARVEDALAACGSTPWSDDAIRVPPYRTICADLDPQGGYLLCRMVQALIVQTLRTSNPDT